MADITNVDPQQILKTVSRLDTIVNGIAGSVGKIEDIMAALDKGWISSVKYEFMSRYQSDAEALREMIDQYEEISQLLTQCAKDYENADEGLKAKFGSLRR